MREDVGMRMMSGGGVVGKRVRGYVVIMIMAMWQAMRVVGVMALHLRGLHRHMSRGDSGDSGRRVEMWWRLIRHDVSRCRRHRPCSKKWWSRHRHTGRRIGIGSGWRWWRGGMRNRRGRSTAIWIVSGGEVRRMHVGRMVGVQDRHWQRHGT